MADDICAEGDFTELLEIPNSTIKKWQNTVNTMAKIMDVPTGLIMRLNKPDIEVCVASETAGNPYKVGDHEHFNNSGLYCETVIKTDKMLLVPNALADENWCNNPDVKLNMISYLGFPLKLPDGDPFGTICVLDNKKNEYSQTFIELIKNFILIIESELDLIYSNHLLGEENKLLSDYIDEIKDLRKIIPVCANCKRVRNDDGYWQHVEHYIEKISTGSRCSHGLCYDCAEKLYGKEIVDEIKKQAKDDKI